MLNWLKNTGFTLLELLISLALLVILSCLALGSYRSYQIRQNREFAKHLLHINVTKMEQFYVRNGRYVDENGNWPAILESSIGNSRLAVYRLNLLPIPATAQSYCIIATPISGTIQAGDGDICIDNNATLGQPASGGCGITSALNCSRDGRNGGQAK